MKAKTSTAATGMKLPEPGIGNGRCTISSLDIVFFVVAVPAWRSPPPKSMLPLRQLGRRFWTIKLGVRHSRWLCACYYTRICERARRPISPSGLRSGILPAKLARMRGEIAHLCRRHCEERSDEAIHPFVARQNGLLRSARNDDFEASRAPVRSL